VDEVGAMPRPCRFMTPASEPARSSAEAKAVREAAEAERLQNQLLSERVPPVRPPW
jgi:hypothetical protein